MTKITVEKALIERAIEAAFSPYCTQDLAILVPALRAVLAEPAVEPSAVRYDFDGYGWSYLDNGSGSDWLERGMKLKDAELVYTVSPQADKPVARSGVFKYLDEQVRKEMSGFYDAFGMQQPPPPAEVPLLTDDEIDVIDGSMCGEREFCDVFARAIEQAVRQKAGLK